MGEMLIRGGSVVDGTGAPAFPADVRIRDGLIAEIGPGLKPTGGERVFDASGCYVTPGFIEAHTHYDGIMWWEPKFDPLPAYGATTSVMGNCGFSAAPVSDDPAARLEMVKIFSFFEDIPIGPFVDQVPWSWRRWSEYKQQMVANVRAPVNSAAFVGHIAIRLAVLGLEAWDRAATPDEIRRMAALLDDALAAGAMGLSTNLMDHDGDNRAVPTLKAEDAEFAALLDVLERYPNNSLQVLLDVFLKMTGPDSVERLARLSEGRNLRIQLAGGIPLRDYQAPVREKMLVLHRKHREEGRDFWPGFAHVAPTSTVGLIKSLIFAQSFCFPWHEVVVAEGEEAKRALLQDPDWRARARASFDESKPQFPWQRTQILHLVNSDNGVGPVDLNLLEYANQTGKHPSDAMADWFLANGINSTMEIEQTPLSQEHLLYLLKDPMSVGNISDAGAHGQMLCGGGENILLLTQFCRDRGDLTIEQAVHVMTGKLARYFNFADRGELKPGKRADVAVFNLAEIERRPRKKVWDVPDGKGGFMWRWSRDPAPMRLTLCNGVPTFEGGTATGAMPGEIIGPTAPALAAAAE